MDKRWHSYRLLFNMKEARKNGSRQKGERLPGTGKPKPAPRIDKLFIFQRFPVVYTLTG